MNRTVQIAWVVAVVAALAAIVDLVVRPTHWWERTLALAVVIALVAAAIALVRSRRLTTP